VKWLLQLSHYDSSWLAAAAREGCFSTAPGMCDIASGPKARLLHSRVLAMSRHSGAVSGQGCDASRAAQGIVGCLVGRGLPTAPLSPRGRQRLILPYRRVSATSLLDLSPRVRGRCTDNLAVQRKLGELRRESHIALWVTRSTMKIITLSLSSLSLSFGYATCDM